MSGLATPAFPFLCGFLFDRHACSQSVQTRMPVFAKEAGLAETSCGLLKAERYRDRKTEPASGKTWRITLLYSDTPGNDVPSQFPKGLFKCSSLKTANHKQLGRFNEIFLGLSLGSPLGSNVQRRAMSDVPTVHFFHHAEELDLSFDYGLHG
jgi:hypothetical protein